MRHALRLLTTTIFLPLCFSVSSAAYAQSDLMTLLQQRLTAGFTKLETSCGDDFKKYCSTVTPGEGRIMLCMQAHEDKISDGCGAALDEVVFQVETTADHLREAMNSCRGDIDKFCATTLPGQGRLATCLATNRASVSKSCTDAIQKVQDR
jgi:Cysteine rich repeat